jgi:predicted ester cyclase
LGGANRAVARSLIEALWAGRLSEADDHPGYWPTMHTFEVVRTAFPDLSVAIIRQLEDDGVVATHFELTGTQAGSFLGADSTNQKLTWSVVYVDRFEDGKVVEHASGDGWLDLLMRIGALPPPA